MKLNILSLSVLLLLLSVINSCSTKIKEPTKKEGDPVTQKEPAPVVPEQIIVPQEIKNEIINDLYRYPDLTTLLAVKDVNIVIQKITAAGGKIIYNPNRGNGTSIGFLVANLPASKILDDQFIASLDLRSLAFDDQRLSRIELQGSTPQKMDSLSVPFQEIGITELRSLYPQSARGKGVTVGIIDTGIDASHPAFQDRVIYWQDLTQEGDVGLKEVAMISPGIVQISSNQYLKIPDILDSELTLYSGVISEKSLGVQVGDQSRTTSTQSGLDLNQNGLFDDQFPFIVGAEKSSGKWVILVDVEKKGDLTKGVQAEPILDFNEHRSLNPNEAKLFSAFLTFPSTNKTIKYPIIIHTDRETKIPQKITVAGDFNSHGTHVAGIIGANGVGLEGAAPDVNFMSLKVCSGLTCTDQAILRGLVDAFYNHKGIIPEVINISLGSKQNYTVDLYSYLIRDLAAKFGTTFFISASNSGPGIRTINSLGHFGPIVSVGAHVSKNTLQRHYDVSDLIDVSENGLFGFSSAGPNYTGQLRPNIVAPGSALSSVPMIIGGADMYNGTSMSSPLAAGGAAALWSVIKNEAEVNEGPLKMVLQMRDQKIKDSLDSTMILKGISLIDFPLALRTSLENTATQIPFQNVLRQGYGLINIPKALNQFRTYLTSIVSEDSIKSLGFLDFKINQNNGNASDRLYDRSIDTTTRKLIELDIEDDGEREQSFIIERFKSIPMTLKLARVEIETETGEFISLLSEMPFSIAVPGLEGQSNTERELLLGSGLKKAFISVRHLEKMEAGKTYVAFYELYQLDKRVLTLTDVVQRPMEFPMAVTSHYLPSLSSETFSLPAVLSIKEREIHPNRNHRFPVAIRSGDQSLIITANISEGQSGNVLINVFNADGLKVSEATVRRSPQSTLNTGPVKLQIPTSGRAGIYEVMISSSSGRWMGKTKYDVLLKVARFQADKKILNLKANTTQFAQYPSSDFVTILNTSLQSKSISVKQENFVLVESLKPFPIASGKWSFKKLQFPLNNASATVKSTNVLVEDKGGDVFNCITRIDHNLYSYDEMSQGFSIAHSTKLATQTGGKLFSNIPFNKDLYVGVETLMCGLPGVLSTDLKPDQKGINIETSFPGFPMPAGYNSFNTIVRTSANVENNRFLVTFQAPNDIALQSSVEPKLRARSNFGIYGDDADLKETIEINLFQ